MKNLDLLTSKNLHNFYNVIRYPLSLYSQCYLCNVEWIVNYGWLYLHYGIEYISLTQNFIYQAYFLHFWCVKKSYNCVKVRITVQKQFLVLPESQKYWLWHIISENWLEFCLLQLGYWIWKLLISHIFTWYYIKSVWG